MLNTLDRNDAFIYSPKKRGDLSAVVDGKEGETARQIMDLRNAHRH